MTPCHAIFYSPAMLNLINDSPNQAFFARKKRGLRPVCCAAEDAVRHQKV